MDADPFDLRRFVDAQEDSYAGALAEIGRGAKRTHWMWFVFPQAAGLGHSAMARRYAIGSDAEARAYFAHPVLGPRYRACLVALAALPSTVTAQAVFGGIDAMKLCSSLDLFARVAPDTALDAARTRWCAA